MQRFNVYAKQTGAAIILSPPPPESLRLGRWQSSYAGDIIQRKEFKLNQNIHLIYRATHSVIHVYPTDMEELDRSILITKVIYKNRGTHLTMKM